MSIDMNLETEQLKLRLIETQVALLQYQHKEITENIAALMKAENDAAQVVDEVKSSKVNSN